MRDTMNLDTLPEQPFRVDRYKCRTFAVYERDQLVVVTMYRKGAEEVARRLNEAARLLSKSDTKLNLRHSENLGELPL
jgi:hypothetical protein